MRWLIVNTDYPGFLRAHYTANPRLYRASYGEQLRARRDSLFGVADFYSANLRELGHEAWEVYANNVSLQRAWARKHDARVVPQGAGRGLWPSPLPRSRPGALTPVRRWARLVLGRMGRVAPALGEVLAAQLAHYRPDVILNQAVGEVDVELLRQASPRSLVVGQIASPLPSDVDYRRYDLMVSSLPNLVARFRGMGVASELSRLAFEPRVLERFGPREPSTPVSFVGSVSPAHAGRIGWLDRLCRELPVEVWGDGVEQLPPSSPIRPCFRGPAWGVAMYEVMRRSRITLNRHIDVAEGHANNMRLFEATGSGALLVTDHASDLHELFEPGREVIAYRTDEECVALVRRLLADERESEQVARLGQARTLRDHTYRVRLEELAGICRRRIDEIGSDSRRAERVGAGGRTGR
jgi:spore maturation protein CgeB